jgi:threonine dehydrogenase-like Zn-dependent dehydrogenase
MQFLYPMPATMLSWRLKGTGLANLGADGKPDTVPFPRFTDDDLVARVDACGLCFSDIKLIGAGSSHPRIEGRDLAKDPTVPGHEVSLTIVGVGDRWKGRFALGNRYILQADIFYKGKGVAFGYALPGGLSQYVVLGSPVLEGDEGCYLLPVAAKTGRVEAALVEPWTCVIASYQIKARAKPKAGGVLYVAGSELGQLVLDLGGMEEGKYAAIAADGLSADNAAKLGALARRLGKKVQPGAAGLKPTDVVFAGTPSRERFLAVQEMVDADAVIGVHTSAPEADLPVDVGRVHYRGMRLVGSTDGGVRAAYRDNPRETLKPGGKAWFVGGAGPMGTMHVIKAIMDDQGPGTVLVTDMSDERLANLGRLVAILATKGGRKVALTVRSAKAIAPAELEAFGGFDDVVGLVPVPAIITDASRWLGSQGVYNIFAGVKVGTIADLPLELVVAGKVRVTGSSGSPLSAMRDTLALTESGRLATALSLAAVGDMASASRGLQALIDNTYAGKVVIFPFAADLGLRSIAGVARELADVQPRLLDGQYWTNEAEAVFLKSRFFAARMEES